MNGIWGFSIDGNGSWKSPDEPTWEAAITVPFSPETAASGIANTNFFQACWYRREFEAPRLLAGDRLLIHFEAVDYSAKVWVNGQSAITHEGGYTPFTADITELLTTDGPQTVVVCAEDDPADLSKPRGKQDWQLNPHSIWYPRTSGIWQTVWLERVPPTYIDCVTMDSQPGALGDWFRGVDRRAAIGGTSLQCTALRSR